MSSSEMHVTSGGSDGTKAYNAILAKFSSWLVPVLITAVAMQLLAASGDRALAAQNRREIDAVRLELTQMQTSLASGGPPALSRRVDDLQQQVNNEFNKINTKLDNIQALLLKR